MGISYCSCKEKRWIYASIDVYPLPRIDTTLEHLAKMKVCSKMDATSGFWHINIHDEDKEKTGFLTDFGLFEWNRLPMGLCNSPATFQRYMDNLLEDLKWRCVLVYMDDIIIYSESYEQHLLDLQHVFERCLSVGLRLKLSKCEFFMTEMQFLGHVVSDKGIAMDPQKTEAISRIPDVLKSSEDTMTFLGLTGYYRRFIKDYASMARPLTKLNTEDKFNWTVECTQAVQMLKKAISTAPVFLSLLLDTSNQ